MRGREVILPGRLRRIPSQFSWVDHRLVLDGHIHQHSASALALYLFLITVADAEGLSWYSESSLCRELSWGNKQLQDARSELLCAGLIAYRKPVYQVLDLSPVESFRNTQLHRGGEVLSVGQVLQNILAGVVR